MIKKFRNRLRCTQQCPPRKPLSKIAWSCFGVFVGLYLISWLSEYAQLNNFFLIGPFGASAVLIYGVPQGEFSQPRNVLGGHIFSGLIGISVYQYLHLDPLFAGAMAVALATAVMHLTRTLHPPAGATAFIAVIGNNNIHSLAYEFLIIIILGVVVLLFIALLVNNLSSNPKRHYPTYWW